MIMNRSGSSIRASVSYSSLSTAGARTTMVRTICRASVSMPKCAQRSSWGCWRIELMLSSNLCTLLRSARSPSTARNSSARRKRTCTFMAAIIQTRQDCSTSSWRDAQVRHTANLRTKLLRAYVTNFCWFFRTRCASRRSSLVMMLLWQRALSSGCPSTLR